jgi:sulfur carrier protein
MKIVVNGADRVLPDGATVVDVVSAVVERDRGVAVALNGEVVPRGGWPDAALRDGDKVEVLTAAQGG